MDRNDKRRFIEDLTANIKEEIINRIPRMPEEWDGIELRRYIAEKFNELGNFGEMSRSRAKNYKNEVLVRNL